MYILYTFICIETRPCIACGSLVVGPRRGYAWSGLEALSYCSTSHEAEVIYASLKKKLIRFSRARQNMEYKFVELLSCNFIASPEDVIRAHICFRYNTLKSRLALVQARLQDIESLIKVQIIIYTHIYPHV